MRGAQACFVGITNGVHEVWGGGEGRGLAIPSERVGGEERAGGEDRVGECDVWTRGNATFDR